MPTGERRGVAARGFTYLWLLFVLALGGAALAALGSSWQLAAQRERESELMFRGLQIRDAIERHAAATPPGQPTLPRSLDELLQDTRGERPRHHLRRLYADPWTGRPDWVLLRREDGGIYGVHSRATVPALRRHDLGLPPPRQPTGTVADWRFEASAAWTRDVRETREANESAPRRNPR
jgi:type II secretory pathway pseudopilin PulG